MRAHLSQARISPKKANLVAAMVRGLHTRDALAILEKLPKKGADLLHALIVSAIANAENNASQKASQLVIRRLVVNKGPAYRRFLPIARGRSRPIDKWTSHITVELGVEVGEGEKGESQPASRSAGSSAGKGEKGEKGGADLRPAGGEKKQVKDESDIVYSANKPVAEDYHKKASSGEDGESDVKESHGHATFQAQRKGSRGS